MLKTALKTFWQAIGFASPADALLTIIGQSYTMPPATLAGYVGASAALQLIAFYLYYPPEALVVLIAFILIDGFLAAIVAAVHGRHIGPELWVRPMAILAGQMLVATACYHAGKWVPLWPTLLGALVMVMLVGYNLVSLTLRLVELGIFPKEIASSIKRRFKSHLDSDLSAAPSVVNTNMAEEAPAQ